jgi:tRNA(adenine34) deaminase
MTDEILMREALAEARAAEALEEVPVGCVVLHAPTERIVGRGHNLRRRDGDPIAHAEIIALRESAAALGRWQLNDCTLAVTLEPCAMCAGAVVNARIGRVVYGCSDPKAGAVRTLFRICDDPRLNHRAEIVEGILAEECAGILRDFFKAQRALGKK